MDRFFKFLFENPILLVLVIGWILSLVGGVLRKAAANAQRQQQRREPGAPARHAPRRSPEEIAAEMRRILGVDEPPAVPRQTPPPPAAAPASRPVARTPFAEPVRRAEVEARPLQVEVVVGDRARAEVQSHVGEALQRRAAPTSGGVGRRPVSQLAGQIRAGYSRRIAAGSGHLVDLGDLRRAIVMREILDPPLAMRADRFA